MKYACDYLVFDISSVLYRTFYANKSEDDTTIAGLASHSALTTLNKYYKAYPPAKGVVMAFDRSSWRKAYTASELAVTKKPYKGNRRKDMSPSQQQKYERFLGHLNDFETMITEHTAIVSLAKDKLEADDLIAGFTQVYTSDDIIVISSDSDLLQLTRNPRVRVVSPATGKDQSLEEYDGNPDYYTFFKCIRGDTADNIQSAYPGVRATAIKKAWEDEFARINLMQQVWKDEKDFEYKVGDLFDENEMLIHLEKQPAPIRRLIESTVTDSAVKDRAFSMFHFMKFLGKYQLNRIRDSIDLYVPMLSKKVVLDDVFG